MLQEGCAHGIAPNFLLRKNNATFHFVDFLSCLTYFFYILFGYKARGNSNLINQIDS
jgi:hypothetical protein